MSARGRAAAWLVARSVRRLPPRQERLRYELEFWSELAGMSATRQVLHALGIWCASWALRDAVLAVETSPDGVDLVQTDPLPVPFGCRLNLRHHWERRTTEDGGRYLRCGSCGKDRFRAGYSLPIM